MEDILVMELGLQKKGIATLMIVLALEKCDELGITRVLMVCNNNVDSAKSIVNNKGILENGVMINGILYKRYWIEIKERKRNNE